MWQYVRATGEQREGGGIMDRISDRTETRLYKKKKKKLCGRERQRAWGIKYLKWWRRLLVWREWERGVRCELQIVGAHVVEVAQVPGALLFHGSYSLSVKTAQPCRQLCSGGCGGARRGPLFSILILISISGLIFLLALCITIPPNFFGLCRVCSFYLQKYHKINLQQPWQYLHVQCVCVCFYKVKPCNLICLLSLFFFFLSHIHPLPPQHTHMHKGCILEKWTCVYVPVLAN